MNREILFRGKRKDAPHQWIAGDLNHIDGNVYIFDRDPNSDLNSPDWYEVNPETVGQFTGLLDKEGNKIFEGDICSVIFTPQNTSYHGNFPNQYARKVEIRFIGYGFKALNISTKSARNSRNWKAKSIGAIEFSEFEVIGNIFDHPHLLNKTSNQ